jgi:tetratricopeptide (TPR) repeat protein
LCARVALLVRLDRIDDARKDFERAKALTPRDAKERAERDSAAATLLLADARYDEAISAYESAVAAPDQVRERLMLARATMLEMFGQKDAALWAFEQALEFYPLSGGAWFGRADLVKFTRADPAIAAMEALLAPEAQPSFGDRTHLNFALGKAFLDIGDSPAAFRHLHEGNRLKRTVTSYDSEEASRQLAAIAEAFTPELLNRLAGLGARSSTPIFVVGMPRSGATLIEQILAAHSAIRGAGELPYVGRIVEELDEFPASVASLDGERFKRLGEDYLSRVSSAAEGKTRVVDKMPGNFALVGLIRLILPDAKIIHSRRNPVDACLSCYSKLFSNGQNFSYDLIELGRYHRDYQTLMAHWRAVLPPSHFLEVDYEAVVDDVEAEARRMLEFLELPWDPACLEFYRVERPVRTASVNQVRQPIYRTSSGRWRQHADELRPLLQALGIETA